MCTEKTFEAGLEILIRGLPYLPGESGLPEPGEWTGRVAPAGGIVPWRAVRELAARHGLSPREGERRALCRGLVPSRYLRHVHVLGLAGLLALRSSAVLVAGCGGLGCMVAEFLTRLGIGRLVLVDKDRYDDSNLNRQLACTERTLGRYKAEVLSEHLHEINGAVELHPQVLCLESADMPRLLQTCQAVVDALDNLPARQVVHRAAFAMHLPLVYGALDGDDGEAGLVGAGQPVLAEQTGWACEPGASASGAATPPDAPVDTVAATAAVQTRAVVNALVGRACATELTFVHLDGL